MRNATSIIFILLISLLGGCAAGTYFTWEDARKIEPGMTTAEVTKLVGPPYSVTATPNGELFYVWVYVQPFGGTKTLRVDFKDNKAIMAPPIPDSFQN